jgi:hypothetical protein
MFTDMEDTANGDDLYAEEYKVSVDMLIKNRISSDPTLEDGGGSDAGQSEK